MGIERLSGLSYRTYDFLQFIEDEDESENVETGNTSKPEEGKNILLDETSRIQGLITSIYYDNSLLLKVEPRQFEELIAELLHAQGFKVELTKQTRDNGYDILALKYLDGHIPLNFL